MTLRPKVPAATPLPSKVSPQGLAGPQFWLSGCEVAAGSHSELFFASARLQETTMEEETKMVLSEVTPPQAL